MRCLGFPAAEKSSSLLSGKLVEISPIPEVNDEIGNVDRSMGAGNLSRKSVIPTDGGTGGNPGDSVLAIYLPARW